MNMKEVLYEARLIGVEHEADYTWGWVSFEGVRLRVDLCLIPNTVEGQHILLFERVALGTVEAPGEIH